MPTNEVVNYPHPMILETGSCFCGAIAVTLSGEPFWICFDHDDDCRRALGSPLTVWVGYRPSQVAMLRGSPKLFSKTPGVSRGFCPDCGTSISYTDEALPDEIYLTIGFMDKPERFHPQAHAYVKMKLPWVQMADDLPQIDQYSRPRSSQLGNPKNR